MAIGVTHSTVVVVADDGTSPVGTDEWNAGHTLSGFGTGVQTALAINVGTAGAPVVLNGAGGTPSSMTGTNITGIPEGGLSLTNITTNDVSITKHGFAPILPNDATKYLDGTGAYSVPAGSGGGSPGGSNTQLQYNNSSAFGGASGLTTTGTELTITPAVNAVALTIPTVTTTAATKAISVTQTQNSTATHTGLIFGNLIPGGSTPAAASLLMDLQYNTSSVFKVQRDGNATLTGGLTTGVSGITLSIFGVVAYDGGTYLAANGNQRLKASNADVVLPSDQQLAWANSTNIAGSWTIDTRLGRHAAATLRQGGTDADTNALIVAQTFRTQGALAGGTSDQAGKDFTLLVSPGKGTGVGGKFIVQTTAAGSTGTTVNAGAAQLTIDGPGNVVLGNAAIATNATDGFLYIPTCAGTPSGTPTTYTGRVALVYDTTNHKMYVYDGAWKGGTAPGAWS